MKRFSRALVVVCCSFLFGCGEKPPVAENDSPAKPAVKPEASWPAEPSEVEPKKPNPPKAKKPPEKKPEQAKPGKEPPFVKPKPGFNPVKLPNVPDAPKGFAGKNKPDDAELPVELQQKLNSDKPDVLLGVLRNSPYPLARTKAANKLKDEDYKDARAEIVLGLRGALRDSNEKVVREAILSLRDMKATEAVGDLAGFLYHPNENLQEIVLIGLEYFGPAALPVKDQLANALRDPDYRSEIWLFSAVGKLGPEAAPQMVPLLQKKLASSYFKDNICEALGGLGAEEELLELLNGKDARLREEAAKGTIKLPTYGSEITARLIAIVKGNDEEATRRAAIEALGNARPTTPAIVGALEHASKEKNERLRSLAAEAFSKCDPKLPEAVPFLVALSKDSDESVRRRAAEALGNYQTNSEDRLLALLDQAIAEEEFSGRNEDALKASGKDFLPRLLSLAKDPQMSLDRRVAALLAFEHAMRYDDDYQEHRQEQTPAMLAIMNDTTQPPALRAAAATAVRAYDVPEATAVWVAGASQTDSLLARLSSVEWLGRANDKRSVIPVLVKLLEDPHPKIFKQALSALPRHDDSAADAVPVLVRIAANPQHPEIEDILDKIGTIAAQPAVCMPLLEKYAFDKDFKHVGEAAMALGKVLGKNEVDVLPDLRKLYLMIAQVKPDQRSQLIIALGEMGPKAAPSVPRLIELLKAKDEPEKFALMITLKSIGPAAKAAAPVLLEIANTDNHDQSITVRSALEALREIKANGPELAKIVPTILKNKDLHEEVLETLTAYGPEVAAAAPVIIELLPQLKDDERSDAWRCLKAMGPAAAAAAPGIQAWLPKITDDYERRLAQEALKAVKP